MFGQCGSMHCRTRGIDATRRADMRFLFWFLVFSFFPSSSYAPFLSLSPLQIHSFLRATSFEHRGLNDDIVISQYILKLAMTQLMCVALL